MSAITAPRTCDPATNVTRSLLGWGVVAGPFYVVVSLSQAVLREGFDLGRHQWSLLANGPFGWVQVLNFVLTGLMVLAAALGLHRSLGGWAPRLVAGYGLSLIAAGLFRADPALGFPAGTPEGAATTISRHGVLHLLAGGLGFAAVAAACLVIGTRYARAGRRGMALFSRGTGVVFLTGFAMLASSGGARLATLAFTGCVVLVWAWLAAVCADRYSH